MTRQTHRAFTVLELIVPFAFATGVLPLRLGTSRGELVLLVFDATSRLIVVN